MRVLDLFCGLGGWSKPWIESGHDVTGIDIKDVGFPGHFIEADLMEWEPKQDYDVILASPPCTSFSWVNHKWNGKPMTGKGLDLVYRTWYLIQLIKPKYWVIENVRGLSKYIHPPSEIIRYGKGGSRKEAYLWSNIGKLGFFPFDSYKKTNRATYRTANPVLAEIPKELSKAVMNQITERGKGNEG